MRIIAWNINGGLQKKWPGISNLNPDVVVLSECEELGFEGSIAGAGPQQFTSTAWIGINKRKGLLVATLGTTKIIQNHCTFTNQEFVLPVNLQTPHHQYLLFGVWAFNHRAKLTKPIVGQVVDALTDCASLLTDRNVIIAGDLNNNILWDKKRKPRFQNLIEFLARHRISSVYHRQSGQGFGHEAEPTIYWRERTKEGRKYHIDYSFVSENIFELGCHLKIGAYADYVGAGFSDHSPLILDIF